MPNSSLSRRDFQKLLAIGVSSLAVPATARVTTSESDPSAPIRLHYNENPAGLAPAAKRVLGSELIELAWQYPGELWSAVVGELTRLHGIDRGSLILGNGSSELLAVATQTFGGAGARTVIASPTYDAVALYAEGVGGEVSRLPLGRRYAHELAPMIDAVGSRGVLYICNPNNPTGTITPKAQVRAAIDAVPDDVVVIVDEAYHHYVTSDDYESVIPLVAQHPNLLVLRTFSKIYAMAGLRCGYGIAQPALIAKLRQRQARNNMNVAALLAAKASLEDPKWVEQSKQVNLETRTMVFERLGELDYDVTPSEASFFMVNLGRDSREVASAMATRGVLVGRPFPPMTEYLRVSIGTRPQMERFLGAFEAVMG